MHVAYNSRNLRNVKMWKMIKFVQAMNTTWKLNYTWQECVLCMWALSTNDIIEIKKKKSRVKNRSSKEIVCKVRISFKESV